jgi:hypothetical protein
MGEALVRGENSEFFGVIAVEGTGEKVVLPQIS